MFRTINIKAAHSRSLLWTRKRLKASSTGSVLTRSDTKAVMRHSVDDEEGPNDAVCGAAIVDNLHIIQNFRVLSSITNVRSDQSTPVPHNHITSQFPKTISRKEINNKHTPASSASGPAAPAEETAAPTRTHATTKLTSVDFLNLLITVSDCS